MPSLTGNVNLMTSFSPNNDREEYIKKTVLNRLICVTLIKSAPKEGMTNLKLMVFVSKPYS